MTAIFVDADGCPVKEEVYRVATGYGIEATLVANSWLRIPQDDRLRLVVVGGGPDAADDWIAEHVAEDDIVVSGDIPLASRCLEKGAMVLDPRGGIFTEENIRDALVGRELLSHLRDLGTITEGPAPIGKRQRSRFRQRLEETVLDMRRGT